LTDVSDEGTASFIGNEYMIMKQRSRSVKLIVSFILKKVAIIHSETAVFFYQTTALYIIEGRIF
jgi:hypothetical protein